MKLDKFLYIFILMLKHKTVIIFFCLGILSSLPIFAQTGSAELQNQKEKLQQIEQEISEFREQLESTRDKEKTIIGQLNSIDKDLNYTQRLIQQMERTQRERKKRISELNGRLAENRKKVQNLRQRFAGRIVHIYKQGSYNDLELLLTSESLNQAIYRYKYLKIINEADKKIFNALQSAVKSIESDRAELERELTSQQQLLADKRSAQDRLQRRQNERKQVLNQVQSNKQKYAQAIKDRESASRELERKIVELQESSSQRQREKQLARQRTIRGMTTNVDIASLKGKLPWPTEGEIIARFGTFKHPKLNTITENTGIDIAAPKGHDVTAVLDGLVTTITWLRGYGSMIIVDHGNGFYTVYTHVIDITVEQGDYVDSGDVIARVGDSGSLDGSKLHFEIYGNDQKLNPEIWLSKPV